MEKGKGEKASRVHMWKRNLASRVKDKRKTRKGKTSYNFHPLRKVSGFRFAFWMLTVESSTRESKPHKG